VVDLVHGGEVAGVERAVALLHEREQARGPAGVLGRDGHEDFLLLGGDGDVHGRMAVALRAAARERHENAAA
jgi:hypothetical protein